MYITQKFKFFLGKEENIVGIFSFSHSIFQRVLPQGYQKLGLFGKKLMPRKLD